MWRCAVLTLALFVAGCGGPPLPIPEKDKALLQQGGPAAVIAYHDDWPPEIRKAASQHEARIGMTRLQMLMAWGTGSLRESRGGAIIDRQYRERWFYDCGPLLVVAYFLDDRLVACKAFDDRDVERTLPQGELGYSLPCESRPAREEFVDRITRTHPQWNGRLPPP